MNDFFLFYNLAPLVLEWFRLLNPKAQRKASLPAARRKASYNSAAFSRLFQPLSLVFCLSQKNRSFALGFTQIKYSKSKTLMNIKHLAPLFHNTSKHGKREWRTDVMAGITVAVMLVPQGMAYSMLAGIPPIYGLYGAFIPLLLYGIFGASRHLAIGPVAIFSLLIFAGVSQIADPFTPEYLSLVILSGLLVGLLQLLFSALRLGFLVNFISHPVIIGFTSAAAIIIAVGQLKDMMGIAVPKFHHLYQTVQYVVQHISEANLAAVGICISSIIIMAVFRKINRNIPGALFVVILFTVFVYYTGDKTYNLNIIGSIPEGLPTFILPDLTIDNIVLLLPTVMTMTLIGIVESIGITKLLQSKAGTSGVQPNQELFALGVSKIFGSFFQSIPTSGSFSRSAVNYEAGSQSGVSSIVSALLIGLTLLFFTPLFYFLPKAVLAAIIIYTIRNLFEWKAAKELWKTHRSDFFMMFITFVVTLFVGIKEGVLAGVLLSILIILLNSTRPNIAVLGRLPNTVSYRNINRFEMAEQIENTLIVRFDDQLYFANAGYLQDRVRELVNKSPDTLDLFILDARCIHSIDSSGSHAFEELYDFFQSKNINFYIAGLVGAVRDRVVKAGLIEKMGSRSQFLDVHQAITHYKSKKTGKSDGWSPDAIQSNNGDNMS